MHVPRTWFATTEHGLTVLVQRHDAPDAPPSHQVYVLRNYLTTAPEELPLPEGFPEQFSSREDAVRHACRQWPLREESFQDVRLGRCVTVDFIQALRDGTLGPIHQGMSSEALVETLGVPEYAQEMHPGHVFWFYGSVLMLLQEGALVSLEIDDGVGDFTSFQLDGWFLTRSSTKQQLKRELKAREVEFAEVPLLGGQVLRTPRPPAPRVFTFDFHEDGYIHALYWKVGV